MNPRRSLPVYDAPDPVMRAAGAWLSRRDRGLSAAEQAEFDQWRRAHPSHQAAVAQLEHTLEAFDGLRVLAPEAGTVIDEDFFAPREKRHLKSTTGRRHRPRVWAFSSLLAAAAAIALIAWLAPQPSVSSVRHYTTVANDYERVLLEDGSVVELNADTVLAVDFSPAARGVRLERGEAHFQVAKDPARPFVVTAGTVEVRAVGTAFNVRLEAAAVEVLVTAGKVQVAPPPVVSASAGGDAGPGPEPSPVLMALPLLEAGQRVVVPTEVAAGPPVIGEVTPDEMVQALAWQPRVLELRKTPLSAIVAEFNRHADTVLRIDDPELGALLIGGNFRLDQPDAFVRLLETGFGIVAERVSEKEIVLRRAP